MYAPTLDKPFSVATAPAGRVLIKEARGRPLTDAIASSSGSGQIVDLQEVGDPSALIEYCVGRGGQFVTLEWPGVRITGVIATAWDGVGRRWWVETAAVGPQPLEA